MSTRRWRSVLVAATVAVLGMATVVVAEPAYAASCPTVDPVTGAVSPQLQPGELYEGCALPGADLRGADLSYVALIDVSLAGAQLDGALAFGSFVSGGTLAGADLSDVDLTGATVVSTSLAGADLDGAILDRAQLFGADLAGASMAGARIGGLTSSSLTGSLAAAPSAARLAGGVLLGPGVALPGVALEDLDLRGVDLTRADLRGALVARVDLRGVDLAGADVRGAAFVSSLLTGSTGLTSALISPATTWDGSTCPDGRLSRAHLGQRCERAVDTAPPVVSLAPTPAFVPFRAYERPTVRVLRSDAGSSAAHVSQQVRIASMRSGGGSLGAWVTRPWSSEVVVPTGAAAGRRTCVQVRARDLAGNVSAWSASRCFDVPIDESRTTQTPRWRSRFAEVYQELNAATTTKRGQSLTTSPRTVRTIGVLATTCPTCGSVTVYVGSRKLGVLSTRRSTAAHQTLLLLPRLSAPVTGKVRIVVRSQGKPVTIDGIAVSAY